MDDTTQSARKDESRSDGCIGKGGQSMKGRYIAASRTTKSSALLETSNGRVGGN